MAQISRYQTVFTGVAGTPWYSNLFFEGGTPEGEAYGPDVVAFWEACNSQIHSSITWVVDSTYTVIEASTGLIVDIGDWAGGTGTGDQVAEPLPWANQAVINWRTNTYIGGRELRGRTFVPALTQAINNNGVLTTAGQIDLQAAADGLITDSAGAFCIFSPTHLTESVVEQANVPLKIGVLRSRRD